MRRWGCLLVIVVLVVVGAGACGGDDGGSASAGGCEPVGDGGGTKVAVALDEWSVKPEPATAAAGKVTFDVRNEGMEPHELVVVRGVAASDLKVVAGKVDEDALPASAFVGEVEGFAAGQQCEGTFELAAGSYTLFCNIVEQHDAKLESHFEEGMVTSFEVR